eukprot:TRINITY_DN3358_c1_g1_i1.p1 TRINITY_DN3358_c1_g1~~TRINITY_DN3358_c1_g1_i1.p1  ORF type:complete len:285 (-),score=117.24 TRINITY_DN3358_c1_g1_i1:220-1074(-)
MINASSRLPIERTAPLYKEREIRDVWADNLDKEIREIMLISERYRYIALDTEFPGIVVTPIGNFTESQQAYQTVRCNVEVLKLIQVGLTFSDENGNLPKENCTWQFNFKFDQEKDMHSPDSIKFLQKAGVDFTQLPKRGIDIELFGEMLITLGLVLDDKYTWLTFHSNYDFAYLIKVLLCRVLPEEESQFLKLIQLFFPRLYDLKHLCTRCRDLEGSLSKLAGKLQVLSNELESKVHTAGADSLLTSRSFFKLRSLYFDGHIDDSQMLGVVFGLSQQRQLINNE